MTVEWKVDSKQDKVMKRRNKSDIDGVWGWVVSCASCVGLVLALSLTSNSGIFYAYMIEEFNVELTTLTFIGSISTTISFTGGSYFTVNSFSFL